jgi:hypothetical protein
MTRVCVELKKIILGKNGTKFLDLYASINGNLLQLRPYNLITVARPKIDLKS